MPYVKIELFEGRSPEQKEKLAKAITTAFVEHAGAKPEGVWVLFQDVRPSDWMTGGVPGKKPAP